MPTSIKNYIKESRNKEIVAQMEELMKSLEEENLSVEFGNIGNRTTYAFIHDEAQDIEIVGYTFIKDMKYYNPELGKLKALQQAMARRELAVNSK